jgi:hypothetical protein
MDTTTTERTNRIISKCGKFRPIGLSTNHPTRTVNGATKREICMLDPIATIPIRVGHHSKDKDEKFESF